MKGAQKMTFRDFTSVVDYRTLEANSGPSRVDPSPFVGTWVNTNDSAPHRIARLVMTVRDGILMVHAWGYCTPDPCDWGEASADVYADSINSQTAMSFTAVFDFGFMETHLQTNLKRGTMVIATANKFGDLSGRSDYYTREFFYQVDDDSF
jgi:hypothetical protein